MFSFCFGGRESSLLEQAALLDLSLLNFSIMRGRQRTAAFGGHPEQFQEARLVRITHGGLSTCLDPFGMLDSQVVVNLLQELRVGVDLLRHGNGLGKEGSAVSRGALMLGVIFMLPLLSRYWAQVNGEQGWLCTKLVLLLASSSAFFRHSWYARCG